MSIKYFKWPSNRPNVRKIYQHLPLQDPPKFTQTWIFGLKIYHLATLGIFSLKTVQNEICFEAETKTPQAKQRNASKQF
jgi:hypothetical protein